MLDEQEVRKAAREAVAEATKTRIKDHDPLVSSGLIDSLSILKLISSLERKLAVAIPTEKVQPDDFDSVDLIVETIQRVTA
jgi:acyl carrier protein